MENMIIYEDDHIIVLNKPPGTPVQPDKTGDPCILDFIREKIGPEELFVVHRIDRPCSGAVMVAKSKKAASEFSKLFKGGNLDKIYLAAVRNKPEQETGTLKHYLKKSERGNKVLAYSTEQDKSRESILEYHTIGKSDHYYFLKINLLTGRQHQIRAQLSAIGCPLKGDVKYGDRRKNKDRSIHLHAWKLKFSHPFTGELVKIIAPFPEDPVWNACKIVIPSL